MHETDRFLRLCIILVAGCTAGGPSDNEEQTADAIVSADPTPATAHFSIAPQPHASPYDVTCEMKGELTRFGDHQAASLGSAHLKSRGSQLAGNL